MANNNKNKTYRVYRVMIDDAWGVEWRVNRYLDTREEALALIEQRMQNPKESVRYVLVHKSREAEFQAKMQEKLNKWKAYQAELTKRASKLMYNADTKRGCSTPYSTRVYAHGFTGGRRIA